MTLRQQIGPIYRKKSAHLRKLLSTAEEALSAIPGGEQVLPILAARHAALAPVARQLAELAAHEQLCKPLSSLYSSFIHMHCNRLIDIKRAREEEIIALLERTRYGLANASIENEQTSILE